MSAKKRFFEEEYYQMELSTTFTVWVPATHLHQAMDKAKIIRELTPEKGEFRHSARCLATEIIEKPFVKSEIVRLK